MTMIFIFVILCLLPNLFAIDPYSTYTQLNLPPRVIGPESVALDRFREGPYIGVSDGRILKYDHQIFSFKDFAYTSPSRTKEECDGVTDINLGPKCGRPLGFSFHLLTGVLYIVDTFNGLYEVGPRGGKATLIAKSANGVPFRFLNGIDVDQLTGDVYFTDASQTNDLRNAVQGNIVFDSTGRLMKFSPLTRTVEVLLDGLPLPGGPVISHDRTFLLFSETSKKTIYKYWLQGLRARTTEDLLLLDESPSKIKRAKNPGEFWVAANRFVQQPHSVTPFGYKFNSAGQVSIRKEFGAQYQNIRVNVVQEYDDKVLYVGSRDAPFVGIYSK